MRIAVREDHYVAWLEGYRLSIRRLRESTPFVPHITVAAYAEFERCLALAQELNLARPYIEGTIDRVEVVAVSLDPVHSLATVSLGGISEPEEDRRTRRYR